MSDAGGSGGGDSRMIAEPPPLLAPYAPEGGAADAAGGLSSGSTSAFGGFTALPAGASLCRWGRTRSEAVAHSEWRACEAWRAPAGRFKRPQHRTLAQLEPSAMPASMSAAAAALCCGVAPGAEEERLRQGKRIKGSGRISVAAHFEIRNNTVVLCRREPACLHVTRCDFLSICVVISVTRIYRAVSHSFLKVG